jgi:hypothetical protein
MSRLLGFGQPLGGIAQLAFVVADFEAGMRDFGDRLAVGPWFVRERFTPPAGRYRVRPTSPVFSLARGFSGHTMIELIEHTPEQERVYTEMFLAAQEQG